MIVSSSIQLSLQSNHKWFCTLSVSHTLRLVPSALCFRATSFSLVTSSNLNGRYTLSNAMLIQLNGNYVRGYKPIGDFHCKKEETFFCVFRHSSAYVTYLKSHCKSIEIETIYSWDGIIESKGTIWNVASNATRHFIVVELSFSKGRYFRVGRYFRKIKN